MDDSPLTVDSPLTMKAIDKLLVDLRRARDTRLPAQHGDQEYDRCSTTIITWLWCSLTDYILVRRDSSVLMVFINVASQLMRGFFL